MKMRALWTVLLLLFSVQVWAVTPTPWTKMPPGANGTTVEALNGQCKKLANFSTNDYLQPSHCDWLQSQNGTGTVILVDDGVVYDLLSGYREEVQMNQKKQLGRQDRAIRAVQTNADGSRVVYDWFTGVDGQSCNNLAIFYLPPPSKPESPPPANGSRHIPMPSGKATWIPGSTVTISTASACASCCNSTASASSISIHTDGMLYQPAQNPQFLK